MREYCASRGRHMDARHVGATHAPAVGPGPIDQEIKIKNMRIFDLYLVFPGRQARRRRRYGRKGKTRRAPAPHTKTGPTPEGWPGFSYSARPTNPPPSPASP